MKKSLRRKVMLVFTLVLSVIAYISIRGEYLENLAIGEQYTKVFFERLQFSSGVFLATFLLIYIYILGVNLGIKKGVKPFFEKEGKQLPKFLNKSVAFVIAVFSSLIVSNLITSNLEIFLANVSFNVFDPVFGLDISYYMFQKPLIEKLLYIMLTTSIMTIIYTVTYYIIVINMYFDGIEADMIKKSPLFKKIYSNASIISIIIASIIMVNNQNMVFGRMFTINDNTDIIGAGLTEVTIRLWGYIIFAALIVICVNRALRKAKKGQAYGVVKSLSVIPIYLILLFGTMITFDLFYAKVNELDKEKEYILENITNTRAAYGLVIEEEKILNSGTITSQEVDENINIINNIPVVTEEMVLNTLEDTQTNAGYYTYTNTCITRYTVNGLNKVMYLTPREIKTNNKTMKDNTYEFTHGNGIILTDVSNVTELGNVINIQSSLNIEEQEEILSVVNPRIYFGLETNETIIIDKESVTEYDYTDEFGNDVSYQYKGAAGLELNWLDRLVLAIKNADFNSSLLGNITKKEWIIGSRNVLDRVKTAVPELIYDEEPYMIVTNEGNLVWVIDAYTISSSYPYSNYIEIEHDGKKESINYIRNSAKVLVDAYDGTIKYYVTDRTDPIIMAYTKIYKGVFEYTIPSDVGEKLVYPKYLYDIQSEILKIYHSTRPDVVYREDDIWDIAKYNSVLSTQSIGTYYDSYYEMINVEGKEALALMQYYTPNEKSNLSSYLVGIAQNGQNELKLYTFESSKNVLGPMQLEKQIEQDEVISKEIDALNLTGVKVTKKMLILPINDTLLYVQPIYQTMLNEENGQTPILKKVVMATENKLAIGDSIEEALNNLLSKNAIDFEIENLDSIEGIIEQIIKANTNLTESTTTNNWELIGTDLEKLQSLINLLDTIKNQEDKVDLNLEEVIEEEVNDEIE